MSGDKVPSGTRATAFPWPDLSDLPTSQAPTRALNVTTTSRVPPRLRATSTSLMLLRGEQPFRGRSPNRWGLSGTEQYRGANTRRSPGLHRIDEGLRLYRPTSLTLISPAPRHGLRLRMTGSVSEACEVPPSRACSPSRVSTSLLAYVTAAGLTPVDYWCWAPHRRPYRFSGGRDSKAPPLLPQQITDSQPGPEAHGCHTLRTAPSRGAVTGLSYSSTLPACASKCRPVQISPPRLTTVSRGAEAILCGIRSTLSGRPQGGLSPPFTGVQGSFRSPGCPFPRRPVSLGRIESNGAFQPRALVASQRARLRALRDGGTYTTWRSMYGNNMGGRRPPRCEKAGDLHGSPLYRSRGDSDRAAGIIDVRHHPSPRWSRKQTKGVRRGRYVLRPE